MAYCSKNVLARRYGKALYALAEEHNKTLPDDVYVGLCAMVHALGDKLETWSSLPPDECATRIWPQLERLCKKTTLSPFVINIMGILLMKGRWGLFPHVVEAYTRLWKTKHNIQDVMIETSHPLSADDQKAIDGFLKKTVLGKTLSSSVVLRPSLLEGVRITIGSVMVDHSLAGYFSTLSKILEKRLAYQA